MGPLATHAPSTYKIPTSGDVLEQFTLDFWPEPNREDNVFGSKAVGEPPFMLAISVREPIRDAASADRGAGGPVRPVGQSQAPRPGAALCRWDSQAPGSTRRPVWPLVVAC